jgi:hypothetical protein
LIKRNRIPSRKAPRPAPTPQALVGVPLCYSDLAEHVPSEAEADALVATLAKRPAFYLLAMLNTLLSFYEKDLKAFTDVQGFLFSNLVEDELFRSAQRKFPNAQMGFRPMFHRQQMLVLMKKVMSSAADEGGRDPNHTREGRYTLGRLALMTNDLLDVEEQGRRLKELGGSEELREEFYEEFCTQMLPTYELTNPPNVLMAFVRSAEYFSIFERKAAAGQFLFSDGDSVAERFHKLTGLGLRDYLLLIFTVYLNYQGQAKQDDALRRLINEPARFNVGVDVIFSKMRLAAEERRAFFRQTATDFDSLAEACRAQRSRVPLLHQYDFTAFRSHPLIYTRQECDIVTCIDSGLLAEKVSTGVYYTIKKSLEDGAKASEAARRDHDSFLSHWGSVFEIYVNDRLRGARCAGLKRFYDSPYYDDPPSRSDTQAFDAVLDYGSSIVVIEHKGKYLELGAKYSGRRELFLADLKSRKRLGKGVYQLADNIQLVFNDEPGGRRHTFHERGEGGRPVKQFGLKEIGRVKRVYPMIVHQDFSLGFNGVNRIMSRFFQSEIAQRRVDQDMVRPLSLLTVEDLEVVIPYLVAIPLPEILEEYAANDDPLTTFDKIFKGLCRRRRTALRDCPWIERRKEDLGDELMELFVDFSD